MNYLTRKAAPAPPAELSLSADGPIRHLPPQLINQIAAGEVVTRPAAALKELIENSLDAGATRIEIHVEPDALNFLVRDDGRGMNEQDLRLSIERHATSKIRELADLERIATRGFRGEALAALAAVSRIEVITRRADAAEGRRLRATGGRDPRVTPCGAAVGVSVQVRDLFHNTPARLKFLKNAVAEWGHMAQAAIRQSLARPDVAFSIRWKGKPYLDLPPNQTLLQRLAHVLPSSAGEGLLGVDATIHEVRAWGAVTHPNNTRRDRRHQYFFANGRPIVFRPLAFAMEEAYRGLIMTQRYPMAAILIELPGELIDVNVHPTKEEVRFRNDSLVAGAVHRAVAEALRAADLVPTIQVAPPGANLKVPFGIGPQPRRSETPTGSKSRSQTLQPSASGQTPPPQTAPPTAAPAGENLKLDVGQLKTEEQQEQASEADSNQLDFVPGFGIGRARAAPPDQPADTPGDKASAAPTAAYAEPAAQEEATLIARLRRAPEPPRALTQIAETYVLADAGADGMLVIDQHAAHEKILYLRYLRQAENTGGRVEVQPLLIPHSIELAPADVAAMEALLPALREAGFEVEPFGGRTFIVQALPTVLERLDAPAFLRDLLDEIGGGDLPRELRRLRERIGARAACRAAVMAGDRLTLAEMQQLVDDLLQTEDSLRCPHGRPTLLRLGREQLDRQFGRV